MVKVCTEDFHNSIEKYKGKKVYCFGAGKCFVRFVASVTNICIEGVIDNYLYREKTAIDACGQRIPVFSIEEYISKSCKGDVIVITSLYFKEMIQQLDKEARLDGILCFVTSEISEEELQNYLKYRKESVLIADTNIEDDGIHYQIWEYIDDTKHAGSKAPKDIRIILERMGYSAINVHIERCSDNGTKKALLDWRYKQSMDEWKSCVDRISDNSVLVLQHPFRIENIYREKALLDLKKKNVKIISIVHDVEKLREINISSYSDKEMNLMMEIADVLIVQNQRMKKYFESNWPNFKGLIVLGVFDYITDNQDRRLCEFSKTIRYAGNLEYLKCPFLYKLGRLKNSHFEIYGPGLEMNRFDGERWPENVLFKGVFSPENLPQKLVDGFGLIWDGDRLETCSEGAGKYLKYNSPHKLSLYLASGLPVIVWEGAAVAEFVIKNNVGFSIKSLMELEDRINMVSEDKYMQYAESAKIIGDKLRNGYYTISAIKEAEHIIEREISYRR